MNSDSEVCLLACITTTATTGFGLLVVQMVPGISFPLETNAFLILDAICAKILFGWINADGADFVIQVEKTAMLISSRGVCIIFAALSLLFNSLDNTESSFCSILSWVLIGSMMFVSILSGFVTLIMIAHFYEFTWTEVWHVFFGRSHTFSPDLEMAMVDGYNEQELDYEQEADEQEYDEQELYEQEPPTYDEVVGFPPPDYTTDDEEDYELISQNDSLEQFEQDGEQQQD